MNSGAGENPHGMAGDGGKRKETQQDQSLDGVPIDQLLSARLGIRRIRVEGATRTAESFVRYLFSPALRRVDKGRPFREVLEDVAEGVGRLEGTGVFAGADALMDRSEFTGDGFELADLVVTLDEKSLYAVRTGTSMSPHGDLTTSLDGTLSWRNILGRAETITASASWLNPGSYSSHPSNRLSLWFTKPFLFSLSTALMGNVSHQTLNHAPHTEYSLTSTSGNVTLSTGVGDFSYRCILRDPHDISRGASPILRDECSPSLLSALAYNAVIDTRDNPRVPASGNWVALNTELGGTFKFGDVRLAKAELALQQHVPIGLEQRAAVSLAWRMGAVTGYGKEKDSPVRVVDRYFLGGNGMGGGSSPMRGFETRGVGPMDASGSLGGTAFYIGTAMLSLAAPVGSLLERAFNGRVHMFGTIGDCGSSWMSRGLKSYRETLRIAVGIGIAMETTLGRIELNFCRPLRKSKGDKAKEGLQFALTREFL